jgi:hypothetical protein
MKRDSRCQRRLPSISPEGGRHLLGAVATGTACGESRVAWASCDLDAYAVDRRWVTIWLANVRRPRTPVRTQAFTCASWKHRGAEPGELVRRKRGSRAPLRVVGSVERVHLAS